MKKKYLAILLSVVVALSGVPAVTLNAAPLTMEPTTENEEITTENGESDTEETIVEISEETTDEAETSSEKTENNSIVETSEESSEETSEPELFEESSETILSSETVEEETTITETSSEDEFFSCEEIPADMEHPVNNLYSSIKAVGKNGIQYNNVNYLSLNTVKKLSSESQNAYMAMCDDIASWIEQGLNVSDISISASENEDLVMTATLSVQTQSNNSASISAYDAAQSHNIMEEDVSGVPYTELKVLLQNEDAFHNQLSSDFEKALYDAGKKSIVENGYNYIKISGISKLYTGWEEPCNVFSALAAAYPNKFNWINWADFSFKRQVTYYKESKSYKYNYTLGKSRHYFSTLEKKADTKVKTLVNEANAYAKEHYQESPAYGIIEYFNDWICENNFFEREQGTSTEANIQKGKIYYYSHNCYGPLLYGYGTSEGYSLTMSRLLDAAGIRNMYVTGKYTGDEPYDEYAWNYVEMPDGYWYLIDSIRNDNENSNDYLLTLIDDTYEADSRKWKNVGNTEIGARIDYDSLIDPASKGYSPAKVESVQLEYLSLNKDTLVLKPGQTYQLQLTDTNKENDNYYNKFTKVWNNDKDNLKVAKVNKNGKVTAGTAPGKAIITVESANRIFSCTVYVYQFTNIKFDTNNKTSYTSSYANPDTTFDEEDRQTFTLTVNQKTSLLTAGEVVSGNNLNDVTAMSNKPNIAKVENISLENDTITLDVLPKAVGTAKITITLAGKKAYYTIKITQDLQKEWFDYSNIGDKTYTGKAVKYSIPLTEAGRDCSPKATYKITYSNNKNAGEATITIKGTGKYSGTLTQNFTILPKDMSNAVFRSCSPSKTYNSKTRAATTTVKLGKTTLKAGKDYTILYKDTVSADMIPSDTIPTEAGTYKVSIIGKGNYTGTLSESKTYTIKPNSIKNMTVSYRSTIKYTGKPVNVLKNVKISGNILSSENYSVSYLDKTGTLITEPIEKGKYTLIVTPVGKNIKPTLTKTCIKKKFSIK